MDDILQKLVSFHTTPDDPQSIHEAVDYIASFVAKRGMHVERYESNGHESLVATLKPGHKTPKVMLAAHLDVVPAADELFVMRSAEGKFYGRGTLDMKFAIAAYLQIIDELQDRLGDYDFGLMITTEEELGGDDGTGKLVAEGYIPTKVCILPDGGDNWQVQTFSKGFLALRLVSYGTPAHGSRPWAGVNALYPLMEAIREIKALFPDNTAETHTFNLGFIRGGQVRNQVADEAEAELDIRLVNNEDREELFETIQAICRKYSLEIIVTTQGPTVSFDLKDPVIAPFVSLISEVAGVTVQGSRTMGSNDARFFVPHNIPCISVYPAGGGHHGPNEWIDQTAFHQFKEILQRYLDQMAKA